MAQARGTIDSQSAHGMLFIRRACDLSRVFRLFDIDPFSDGFLLDAGAKAVLHCLDYPDPKGRTLFVSAGEDRSQPLKFILGHENTPATHNRWMPLLARGCHAIVLQKRPIGLPQNNCVWLGGG